jgi:hypothetical protein
MDHKNPTCSSLTMAQFDGSHESKPIPLPPKNAPFRISTQRTKNRFTNLFASNKRTDTSFSTVDTNKEAVDDNSPMRTISPRATACEPPTAPRMRQRTSALKRRKSNRESRTKSENSLQREDGATPQPENTPMVSRGVHVPVTEATSTLQPKEVTAYDPKTVPVASGDKHIPVTDAPYPYQRRGDSVDMGSPTRETALTSHPIVG